MINVIQAFYADILSQLF